MGRGRALKFRRCVFSRTERKSPADLHAKIGSEAMRRWAAVEALRRLLEARAGRPEGGPEAAKVHFIGALEMAWRRKISDAGGEISGRRRRKELVGGQLREKFQ